MRTRLFAPMFASIVWAIGAGHMTSHADDWPLPRGDVSATGVTTTQLADDLSERWVVETGEAIEATPVVAGGRVFVADVFGKLTAIALSDGEVLWTKDYDTGFTAAPAVDDDLLVIGDVEGNVYGLDPASGDEKWKAQTQGTIDGSAAFFDGGVLVTSQDGSLYRFDADDGSQTWVYETGDQIRCSPTLAEDRTFLGGCDGQLHMVDVKSGQAVGEKLPLSGPTGSTVAVRGDFAFLPTMDGTIFNFNWRDSTEIWQHFDEDRAQEYRNSAAVTEDLVIISSQNKNVDALDTKTGERKWRYTLRRRAEASPVVAGNDVWIAATDGRLIRLNLADGKERSVTEYRGALIGSPAIADNCLILADDDGNVRCLGPKS